MSALYFRHVWSLEYIACAIVREFIFNQTECVVWFSNHLWTPSSASTSIFVCACKLCTQTRKPRFMLVRMMRFAFCYVERASTSGNVCMHMFSCSSTEPNEAHMLLLPCCLAAASSLVLFRRNVRVSHALNCARAYILYEQNIRTIYAFRITSCELFTGGRLAEACAALSSLSSSSLAGVVVVCAWLMNNRTHKPTHNITWPQRVQQTQAAAQRHQHSPQFAGRARVNIAEYHMYITSSSSLPAPSFHTYRIVVSLCYMLCSTLTVFLTTRMQ